jgi:regulator of protease activity HflC (stomatin/prohibitin superfamily)
MNMKNRQQSANIAVSAVGGILALALAYVLIALLFFSNPETPAGYVGYVTQGSVFGKTKFVGLQTGPCSTGRQWLVSAQNISVTPYTYSENFIDDESVMSKDNLKVGFRVHICWQLNPAMIKEFVEKYSTIDRGDSSDKVVKTAYDYFLKEPLRTYARDEIQKYNGLEIKDNITPVGQAIFDRVKKLTSGTPFLITSVVVGNIQYPKEVSDAVSKKLAATQNLEQQETQLKIVQTQASQRVAEAEGVAKSMDIINRKLTLSYIQYEAIKAQKEMVASPNHTVIYIPVGPMGVPLVGTVPGATIPNEK